jgi:hypothetical protein
MICVCGHAFFRHRAEVCMANDVRREDGVVVSCDCTEFSEREPWTPF